MGMEAKLEPTPPPVRFSVLQISANDSPTVLNLKGFGERMTVLKGAAGGAVGGTGMMLGEVIMDPQTIILLPIMVPAVAIAGAASAPSNAEWEAMVASQNRATREIARLSALIDSMDKGADLERRIAQRIKAVPDFSSTCISIRGQRRRCPASDGAAKLRIELDNEVSPYLGSGRLLRGNKNQKIEAYFFNATARVRLDLAPPQEDRCYTFEVTDSFAPGELGGVFTREAVEEAVGRRYQDLATILALTLFELPGLKAENQKSLLEQRKSDLWREQRIYPPPAKKCAAQSQG